MNKLIITPLQNNKLLETAIRLPQHGVLKANDRQFVYLDIDDGFIH